ncbi:NADH-quinone oxidoreductase subunit NuoK [Candidatus Desantisbacteria bacterium]|nr:NADH-quinone oxidoreductase subunit NuoK [Candidatus Desantisbacteria bacterium]
MIQLDHYLILGAIIFFIGLTGMLIRRNIFIILMCIELMFNAVNLNLVAFSRHLSNLDGQIFSIFVIAIAACESAIGLAIFIAVNRNKETFDIDEVNLMKW